VIGVATQASDDATLSFDKHATANTTVATGRFNFSSHDFPSGMPSATGMPSIKIMDLHKKKGNPFVEFPLFGAYVAACVPI
jgi:hypothetical protein